MPSALVEMRDPARGTTLTCATMEWLTPFMSTPNALEPRTAPWEMVMNLPPNASTAGWPPRSVTTMVSPGSSELASVDAWVQGVLSWTNLSRPAAIGCATCMREVPGTTSPPRNATAQNTNDAAASPGAEGLSNLAGSRHWGRVR